MFVCADHYMLFFIIIAKLFHSAFIGQTSVTVLNTVWMGTMNIYVDLSILKSDLLLNGQLSQTLNAVEI